MRNYLDFYTNGRWLAPSGNRRLDVINPATEKVAGRISLGEAEDVNLGVAAARQAFAHYGRSSKRERLELGIR